MTYFRMSGKYRNSAGMIAIASSRCARIKTCAIMIAIDHDRE